MARWTDLAEWRGPTENHGGPMIEVRGLVIHIAVGSFEGTISWCRNPASDVSAHFVVARDGRIAQVVDTDVTAWTQRAGNGHWLSVEFEGYPTSPLTAAQVTACARLFARVCQVYGVPVKATGSPTGRGLGHHSMGAEHGVDWGHDQCPGELIKAQKPAIVDRAQQLLEDDMQLDDKMPVTGWMAERWPDLRKSDGKPSVITVEVAQRSGYAHSRAANEQSRETLAETRALRGEVAAMRTIIEQLAAALTAGGGSVDTAAILAGVDEKIAALRADLAEAAQAEAAALTD